MNKKEIKKYDESRLQDNMSLGMAGVDKADIRPPTVLLIQAISKKEDFVDAEGKSPKVGQFFHNGTLRILTEFECYFIWAARGQIANKRKPEQGPIDVYRAIGIMADDFSVFGMVFKSSSLYALGSLFTAVSAKKRGMYSIKCKVSAKYISGEKGEWYVPVVKVAAFEDEAGKLSTLEEMAKHYNTIGAKATSDEEEPETVEEEVIEAGLAEPGEKEEATENVEPDDLPF